MQFFKLAVGAVLLMLLARGAAATTITFDGLSGSHVPFTTYTESGFTATVTSGSIWGQGQFEGNPVPSIFTGAGAFPGSPAVNTIAITQGGSAFAFDGLDFAANFSTASYEFVGTLGGSTVFDLTGTQSDLASGNFKTIGVGVSINPIDTLSIIVNDSASTVNIDNIVVQPLPVVPTPATITFDGLTGSHVPFTLYTESGYLVSVTSGIWGQGQFEGNPVPSIFTGAGFEGSVVNTATVTAGGSQFTFSGLDLAANSSTANYEFVGTLGGSTVFDLTGTQSDLAGFGNFQTVGGGVSNDPIDTLSIRLDDGGNTANIDNIVLGAVAEVAEPSSMATFATGLALFGLWRWGVIRRVQRRRRRIYRRPPTRMRSAFARDRDPIHA
jgi:hypothetical protein